VSRWGVRLIGAAAIIAAVWWGVAWIAIGVADNGPREVLGLSRSAWRFSVNVPLVVFLFACLGWRAMHPERMPILGQLGLGFVLAGLGAMLMGNMLEVGVVLQHDDVAPNEPTAIQVIGVFFTFVGFVLQPLGYLLLGVSTAMGTTLAGWRRWAPLAIAGVMGAWILLSWEELAPPWPHMPPGLAWLVLGYILASAPARPGQAIAAP
jgi:hypothetical protein